MSRVLQVLEMIKIWIYHIYELCWLPIVTNTLSKIPTEHDVDGNNNKYYINITAYFYPIVHGITRLDGS